MYFLVWWKCGLNSDSPVDSLDCSASEDYLQFAYWVFPTVGLLLWGYQTGELCVFVACEVVAVSDCLLVVYYFLCAVLLRFSFAPLCD